MNTSKIIFSYSPQYSDLLYLGIFLIGVGTIGLLEYPFLIPIIWIIVIAGFYFFIREKPSVFFFDDFIELRKGFGRNKKIDIVKYSDVQLIQYCFAEIRGAHLFKITFSVNGKSRTIQYSFRGRPSQHEVVFIEGKGLAVKVVPENAKHKLHQSIK